MQNNINKQAITRRRARVIVVGLLLAAWLIGCSIARLPDPSKTVGERFDAWLKERDDWCRKEGIGPYLDKTKPGWQAKTRYTDCEILELKPWDPNETEVSRFAHSLKLPPPHDQVKTVYRLGITRLEYFEALCREEAGEFIFRTVGDVQAIFEMRPMAQASNKLYHLYALEDPYNHFEVAAREPWVEFVYPDRYAAWERAVQRPFVHLPPGTVEYRHQSMNVPPPDDAKVERYSGFDTRSFASIRKEYSSARLARYGYTWRGIKRPHDRELGIAGGELIVVDLETNEILGFRRGFALFAGNWEFTRLCPRYGYRGGYDKDADFYFWFIGKVLKTEGHDDYFRKLQETVRLPPAR